MRPLWRKAGSAVAVAAVALGFVIMLWRYERHEPPTTQSPPAVPTATPQAQKPAEESPAAGSAQVDNLTDSLIKKADTVKLQMRDGKEIEGSQSRLDILAATVRKRRQEVFGQRRKVFEAIEPYFTAGEALRAQARDKYGKLSEADIDKVISDTGSLEEAFWKAGDYENADSMKNVYEARAILEVAIEQFPDDERLLKQMIEVHEAGWPINALGEGDMENPLYFTRYSRSMEVSDYLWRLWNGHISKKNPADLTYDDLAYCMDLAAYSSYVQPTGLKDIMSAMEKAGSHVPQGFPDYFKRLASQYQLTPQDRLKVVDFALSRCQGQGGEWWRFISAFDISKKSLTARGYGIAFFNIFVDTDYYGVREREENYEELRFTEGRGAAFKGSEERRARLVPINVFNEELLQGKRKNQ